MLRSHRQDEDRSTRRKRPQLLQQERLCGVEVTGVGYRVPQSPRGAIREPHCECARGSRKLKPERDVTLKRKKEEEQRRRLVCGVVNTTRVP
jgi:hypothetical protein